MPVARANDIDPNYNLKGDGEETIVLVNGLADDLETWALQMGDLLSAGCRVLRSDFVRRAGKARRLRAPERRPRCSKARRAMPFPVAEQARVDPLPIGG